MVSSRPVVKNSVEKLEQRAVKSQLKEKLRAAGLRDGVEALVARLLDPEQE